MMETYSFCGIFFCAVFVAQIFGYPYNDISIDCDSMLPDHGHAPQTSSPPYVISVSFDRYDPGNEIQVVLDATTPSGFKAFMVQARELDGNVPVGTFRIVDPNTQGLPCADMTNSAVIHINPIIKHRITTTWIAPQGTRKIRLVATFVQDYNNYWVGVHSKTLSPRYVETNEFMVTNSSVLANDSITSVVSEITADSDTFSESDEDIDLSALIADSEGEYESNTPVGSQDPEKRNTTGKSRRKSVLTLNINCGEGTVSQSSTGACIKSPQGSSQSSDSQSKVVVVKQGSSKGSGCVGGEVASVYNQYGCRDSGADISDQSSYGQSVSTRTDSKGKVITYPNSQPFPPEKIASPKYSGVIYSQGKKPQSGSSESIDITIQNGQSVPACDKSSSSYSIQVCNQLGQSSGSQNSSSFGTQGSKPQTGSSESIRITVQGQPSGSQSSSSFGAQGASSTGVSSSCGPGVTNDSNLCSKAGSQFQDNKNACNTAKDASSYNNKRC
ncbi:P17/29C-like protein DDB_G0287399 isoform X1 [Python bivittatus]|uniref:P17/29C-like protein DDB_G0287399 isoform X1 n=2 Tax=Python bivittatus TaxID=176946 RepID=A0A9F5IJ13_PYTBI|nr:P17/29C-like protein DDB_G0287399 isoform X1 [Python bivittatus]